MTPSRLRQILVVPASMVVTLFAAGAAQAQICPAVGADIDCGSIITITDAQTTVVSTGQGPFDGVEDTMVGVVNNSSQPVSTIGLRSIVTIFGFDGDGLSLFGVPGNALDATGYGGPNAFFSDINPGLTDGTISFITPIAAHGGTAFFS